MTTSLKLINHWNNIVSGALFIKHEPPHIKNPIFKTFDTTSDDTDKCENNEVILCAVALVTYQLMRFNDFLLIQSIYFVHVCSGLPINWAYLIEICVISSCVWVWMAGRVCGDSIGSILITRCVYLEAGRSSAMWFVDVHSYKLPSPSSIFMEHLWHKDSTRVRTHTETLRTVQTTGPISTHTSTLWLQFHKTSVATKIGWRRYTPRFTFIQKGCDSY